MRKLSFAFIVILALSIDFLKGMDSCATLPIESDVRLVKFFKENPELRSLFVEQSSGSMVLSYPQVIIKCAHYLKDLSATIEQDEAIIESLSDEKSSIQTAMQYLELRYSKLMALKNALGQQNIFLGRTASLWQQENLRLQQENLRLKQENVKLQQEKLNAELKVIESFPFEDDFMSSANFGKGDRSLHEDFDDGVLLGLSHNDLRDWLAFEQDTADDESDPYKKRKKS